jgi:hypothetical protein
MADDTNDCMGMGFEGLGDLSDCPVELKAFYYLFSM